MKNDRFLIIDGETLYQTVSNSITSANSDMAQHYINSLLSLITSFHPSYLAIYFTTNLPSTRLQYADLRLVFRKIGIPFNDFFSGESSGYVQELVQLSKEKNVECFIYTADKSLSRSFDSRCKWLFPLKNKIQLLDHANNKEPNNAFASDNDNSSNYTIEEFAFETDWTNLIKQFEELGYSALVKRYQHKIVNTPPSILQKQDDGPKPKAVKFIENQPKQTEPIKTANYSILSIGELPNYFDRLSKGFAVDLETTSLTTRDARIVGISLSFEPGYAYYLPLNEYLENGFSANPALDQLKPYLEDPRTPKFTHNGKYEYEVLKNYSIELKGIVFDSLLGSYLLYPGERLGLKETANRLLNIEMTTFKDISKGRAFEDVPIDEATLYACADADITLQLSHYLRPLLSQKGMLDLLSDIEIPLQDVLAKIEYVGVAIDTDFLSTLNQEFTTRIKEIEATIYELSGSVFNVNSTQQLSSVLFQTLGLKPVKVNKTGASTSSEVLTELLGEHEIIEHILVYRRLIKLTKTYTEKLPLLVHPISGRIHTSFNQTVTATGRLSSSHPNLQNIPSRTEDGEKLRRAIVPSKGNIMMAVDYSQIELRVMAYLSQDPTMVHAFQNNDDIHKWTAATIAGMPVDEVTKDQRSKAKAVNFGIIYGISAFGLAKNIGCSELEAAKIIKNYFKKFPNIQRFMTDSKRKALENGGVSTEFGRFRPIPDIVSSNRYKRAQGERMAINTRVQGTAADIIKLAMIHIQRILEEENLTSKMIIQVHDELVFDVMPSEEESLKSIVREAMENVVDWNVPLVVDIGVGYNWGEAK